MTSRLDLSRDRILAFRRRVGSLDERLPHGDRSIRTAAWAGLQDSMPRAALVSLHARVGGVTPDALDDESLVQLWGPRSGAYVVAVEDVAVFTRGRLPAAGSRRDRGEELAARLTALLGSEPMPYGEAARALGVHPNELRYAAPTGRVLVRWDGARQPVIWTVPPPQVDDAEVRRELARRYLHVFGPATSEAFAKWAGVREPAAAGTFEELRGEMVPVRTPVGDAWILAGDEDAFLAPPVPAATARLLPSGDAYYLHWDAGRELLVPDPDLRRSLWTSRVWPGAVLVEGEIVGTWRRAGHVVTIDAWGGRTGPAREAVEAEAASLPLPGIERSIRVSWTSSQRLS